MEPQRKEPDLPARKWSWKRARQQCSRCSRSITSVRKLGICHGCIDELRLQGLGVCVSRYHDGPRILPLSRFNAKRASCKTCEEKRFRLHGITQIRSTPEETRRRLLQACDWWTEHENELARQGMLDDIRRTPEAYGGSRVAKVWRARNSEK